MADIGFFQGQRAELIAGEVMVLSPQSPAHYTVSHHVAELLHTAFGTGYHVRMYGPIALGQHSEPEPDVAVVVGAREDYATQHPKSALLIVEVSDTSLDSDRTRKASLYARAGIADYWIVNLVDRRLEVRRNPVADPGQVYGYKYSSVTELVPPATVSPLAAPQIAVAVADLIA
jgi:Uma2 family endonuclease